ncbi:hypothetical protein [Rubripirellula tenax]|uniref:hypothetical protein n=1 Tax=Rubripirellula tenax TaxID=2528015 RepID=UPI0011B67268|nr:hypothetical protein [Rubripirellula tenax]
MTPRRALSTYLLLAALLFSNVAGWVHVGACGAASDATTCSEASTTKSCCGHHHCGQPQSAQDESTSDHPEPSHEHDSDRCSVCQNFLAFRHTTLAVASDIVWTPLLTQRLGRDVDSDFVDPIFLSGLSVRGPPQRVS